MVDRIHTIIHELKPDWELKISFTDCCPQRVNVTWQNNNNTFLILKNLNSGIFRKSKFIHEETREIETGNSIEKL